MNDQYKVKLGMGMSCNSISILYTIYLAAKVCISCRLDSTHDYQDKISSLQLHVCTQSNQRCHLGQQTYQIHDTLERKKGTQIQNASDFVSENII